MREQTRDYLILGQWHFDHLVTSWLQYYHTERPHQSKENELLVPHRRSVEALLSQGGIVPGPFHAGHEPLPVFTLHERHDGIRNRDQGLAARLRRGAALK